MIRTITLGLALIALIAAFGLPPSARGSDQHHHGTPEASPQAGHAAMGGTAAGYMLIRNTGAEPDRLIGAETDIADAVEIHEMAHANGVMTMRPLPDGLEIPAGSEVALESGGYHLMLFGLTHDLRAGDSYQMTLRFERAGEVLVTMAVRPRAELPASATPTPLVHGTITILDPWSRPAPAMIGAPEATPAG
ncbi:MAG: copper chaperone PCu(A)C [Thermomicrobiales bacterium]|nr:copper chaperone PCu(A)C [Thermomicrobiales bacterium]